ncbi:MAG TPA: hypothetical protein VK742_16285, partial [Candidatus Sulfotelmatobacter sp.]|nr:hypothetical protein [Candidatus Sulfotelmatobacter sp.]
NKVSSDVGNQLYGALKKRALHTRIVFIEVNMPDDSDNAKTTQILKDALSSIRSREGKLTINEQPAPPAYVIVTNNPSHYNLHGICHFGAAAEGFKIPDFKADMLHTNLRAAIKTREKHIEVFSLMESLAEHQHIPSTFDGDHPDLAFGKSEPRLLIGKTYLIPNGRGGEVAAELTEAVVMEMTKTAHGICKLADGQQIMVEFPLSDEEMAAYRRHPDTFFGKLKKHAKGITDPIDLYYYCLDVYRNSPKDTLLRLMGIPPNSDFAKLSQQELAERYCENIVYQTMNISAKAKGDPQKPTEK